MTMTRCWMFTLEGKFIFVYPYQVKELCTWSLTLLLPCWIASDSDITALAKDKIYTHINLEEMTIHQASTVFSISLPLLYQVKYEKLIRMKQFRPIHLLVNPV